MPQCGWSFGKLVRFSEEYQKRNSFCFECTLRDQMSNSSNYLRVITPYRDLTVCFSLISSRRQLSFPRNDKRSIRSCLRNNGRADSSGRDGDTSGSERRSQLEKTEPLWLRAAVSGVTELLRVFTSERSSHAPSTTIENSAFAIEEIVDGLREDYARAYFLRGEFLESIYTEDCVFADPTIQFSGRELYKRNLKLLVPFFEDPLLTLESINQVENGGSGFIETAWKLRVYLKLPWKPFISVDGRTKYSLNANNKIVKHVESWDVTGLEAVGQIFKPSERAFWKES